MSGRDLSGLWRLKIPFPFFFYPKSHIRSYNSSCVNVCMCVCVHTCAILCVSEGRLGLSFLRNGNFILKVLRVFQCCHTVYAQNASVHFVFKWMCSTHFNYLLKSILFQKEKYFCKVFFFHIISFGLLGFHPSFLQNQNLKVGYRILYFTNE